LLSSQLKPSDGGGDAADGGVRLPAKHRVVCHRREQEGHTRLHIGEWLFEVAVHGREIFAAVQSALLEQRLQIVRLRRGADPEPRAPSVFPIMREDFVQPRAGVLRGQPKSDTTIAPGGACAQLPENVRIAMHFEPGYTVKMRE
jgi:hypothetical protein